MNSHPTNDTAIISVIIPLYREAATLEAVVFTIVEVLESLSENYELILVDDGSPDDTWSAIERVAQKVPQICAVRLSRNFGKESAICAGLERAQGQAMIVMDGDLQHPPSLIPDMLQLWREEHVEVVEAVKADRGKETFFSKLRARAFYSFFKKLTGFDLRGASDFKLMDRRAVNAWLQLKERNIFFRGMSAWVGFKRIRLPFTVQERIGGQSGWSVVHLVKLALSAITAFSSLPLHLITIMGICFALFAIVLSIETLYLKASGNAVSGFTTVILLLLIIGSALMVGLGIIGEYIARIYEEVKGRPRYLVSQEIVHK